MDNCYEHGKLKQIEIDICFYAWSILKVVPFMSLMDNTNKLIGFDAEVVYILSQGLNFTFDILNCGFKWGSKLPNGSWDGITGKVVEKVIKRLNGLFSYSRTYKTNV